MLILEVDKSHAENSPQHLRSCWSCSKSPTLSSLALLLLPTACDNLTSFYLNCLLIDVKLLAMMQFITHSSSFTTYLPSQGGNQTSVSFQRRRYLHGYLHMRFMLLTVAIPAHETCTSPRAPVFLSQCLLIRTVASISPEHFAQLQDQSRRKCALQPTLPALYKI